MIHFSLNLDRKTESTAIADGVKFQKFGSYFESFTEQGGYDLCILIIINVYFGIKFNQA